MRAVSGKRVDVWDPSAEGPWILENLRQAGFEVRSIALADVVLTRADLVVMAGDAQGALGALKLLRDDGQNGDVPVVLLGVPDGIEHEGEGPAFAADAVIGRPVVLESVLRCVRRLLGEDEISHVGVPKPEHTMRLPEQDEPDSSQVFAVRASSPPPSEPPWRPREPTLNLPDDEDEEPTPASVLRSRSDVKRAGSTSSGRTGQIDRTPEPILAPDARADISPWLEDLLKAADRRVFPELPSLLLHFPAADEPPESLVPPELFEAPSLRIDEPVHEDPIDAFTYVGGPAIPPPSLPSDSSAPRVTTPPMNADSVTTAPGSDGGRIAPVLPSPKPPRARPDEPDRGTLEQGEIARVLARIARRGAHALVEITGELDAQLTFQDGELVLFEGDVGLEALASLRRRGRATEAPADEAAALEILRRRVEQGALPRFERDRLLREAREDLLVRLLRAERLSFVVESVDPATTPPRSRPLARPFRAAIVEASARAFDAEVVKRHVPAAAGIALGKEREAGLVACELPAELVELFVAFEGRTFGTLLAAAPTQAGLPGLLLGLLLSEALVLGDPPPDAAPPPEASVAARAVLEAAAALADDGDYFAILGISREAADADLARAHATRRAELGALPLGLLGLDALEHTRAEAIEALDEAFRALADRARRASYREALGR